MNDMSSDSGIEAYGDGLVPQVGSVPKEACASKHLVVIDALINWMILNPGVSVAKASHTNGGPIQYSTVWLKQVASADAFRARLAEKQKELDVLLLVPTLKEKLAATCELAVERVADMLPVSSDTEFILDATEMLLKAQYASYGQGQSRPAQGDVPQFQIDRATFVLAEERKNILSGTHVKPALTLDAEVIPEGNRDA